MISDTKLKDIIKNASRNTIRPTPNLRQPDLTQHQPIIDAISELSAEMGIDPPDVAIHSGHANTKQPLAIS
jgi:hypothetical protein